MKDPKVIKELVKQTKKLKILYVEDNLDAREQMLKMLKNFFTDIKVATNGKEGFELYEKENFDIVLTDINMPILNGIELIQLILKKNSNQKIIVLSAYNDSDYLKECMSLGIRHYLYKPITFDTFINTMLDIEKYFSIQKQNLELTKQIDEILENTEDGYLLFNSNFTCLKTYSKKCLKIFDINLLENQNISELLFKNDQEKKSIFIEGIKNIIQSDDKITKELFLSLLPKEQKINGKYIKIKYKLLENDRFIVILKDITKKKNLEKDLEEKNKVLSMLVAITSNIEDFSKLKEEYELFLKNPPKQIDELFKVLHTFKGNFSQKELLYTPKAIHEVETKLKETNSYNKDDFERLSKEFQKDISIFKKYYGEKYLTNKNIIFIDEESLKEIEHNLQSLYIEDDELKEKIDIIIFNINKLRYIKIYELLTYYTSYISNKSIELSKLINPLIIDGDKNLVGNPKLRGFFKSLVHLFNNSIDHGIEDSDKRVKLGKSEYGTIKCSFEKIKNSLILEISDDGAGIDTDKLTKKALEYNLLTKEQIENMSEEEKLNLVFAEFISTKENTTLTSGRGIGMSAIKSELDKLNAKVFISSKKDKGTTFKFILPLTENFNYKNSQEYDILNQLSKQILEIFNFQIKVKDEKYLDDLPIEEKLHHVEIDILANKEYRCILSYSNTMLLEIVYKTLGEYFSKDELISLQEELAKEVTNIIVGLSLSDFTKSIGEANISTPYSISSIKYREYLDMFDKKYIKTFSTDKGKIYFSLLENDLTKIVKTKKIKEQLC